jgi:hypothetical protein
MKRAHLLLSILLLAGVSLAQQPNNPQDRTANPNDHTYNRPVETGHGWGGWGLLGLLGLAGLMGRKRETTTITGTGTDYTRDDRAFEEQRRRRAG